MLVLYPDIKPYQEHRIDVQSPHQLYVEESGNPDGIPVVFIHGGPGAGTSHSHRRFFDPDKYRIILFDQRGCGRSTPHGCLEHNNTQALVSDMEVIREKLGVETWLLFGGSWGSTLALVYAQTHPQRVRAMILRGIFLCRQQELDWFYKDGGCNRLFPDYWEDLIKPVPEKLRNDLIPAYSTLLSSDNELQRMGAAKAWSGWEGRCATLRPNPDVVDQFTSPHMALSLALIEVHFFKHQAFLEHNQILRNMDRIHHIPGIIVHGRYDVICPLDNAYELHHAWPGSELHIIRDAGHSASEPGIVDALIKATNQFAHRLGSSA